MARNLECKCAAHEPLGPLTHHRDCTCSYAYLARGAHGEYRHGKEWSVDLLITGDK